MAWLHKGGAGTVDSVARLHKGGAGTVDSVARLNKGGAGTVDSALDFLFEWLSFGTGDSRCMGADNVKGSSEDFDFRRSRFAVCGNLVDDLGLHDPQLR